MSEAKSELYNAIDGNRDLFESPKSHIVSGIKVGIRKQKGDTEIEDTAKTIKLLRSKYPELAEQIIIVEEKLSKTALGKMTVNDLKRIGVTVTADTDEVLIKPVDGEIEKFLKAMEAELDEELKGE